MKSNQPRALVRLSEHTFVYRGFTIHQCPRDRATSRTAYQLMSDGNYFGCDFALAEAMYTVDSLISNRRNAA
ncbi:hypothetical protein GCM10022405_40910 [Gibbsiella dentisursi]|uniref:DUF4761 domain-containing protein n=1 Tax=Gibbsiella dentisursi TaxID=796890 RepID=A0ABP7M164_9GAMM